jgi:hypothetical protein
MLRRPVAVVWRRDVQIPGPNKLGQRWGQHPGRLASKSTAVCLRHDPNNLADANCVEVISGDKYYPGRVGFLPRAIAEVVAPYLDAQDAVVSAYVKEPRDNRPVITIIIQSEFYFFLPSSSAHCKSLTLVLRPSVLHRIRNKFSAAQPRHRTANLL